MSGSGPWLAQKLGRTWLFVFEILATAHLAVATTGLRYFDHLYPALWWPSSGLILLVALQLASKGQAEQDRKDKVVAEKAATDAKQDVRTIEFTALARYKRDTAGNLARLLKGLHERTNHARTLQSSFLTNTVDVVKDHLGLSRQDERISATWVIPVNGYTEWETVAYDRNQASRQPGRRRKIAAGIPGAAEAFLTGNDVFIEDTLGERYRQHFDRDPAYRTILSIPTRTRNVTQPGNVTIDGQANLIVGVLNVDCTESGILNAELATVVRDIAYLIGLLEVLNQGLGGGPNG